MVKKKVSLNVRVPRPKLSPPNWPHLSSRPTNYSPRSFPRRDSFNTTTYPYPPQPTYGEGHSSHSLPYSFQGAAAPYGDSTVYQEVLPSQEEVVRRTEAITRCIQELLISAKDEKFDSFIPCSERIVRAVTDMVSPFPGTTVSNDPDKPEDDGYLANEAVYES